MVVLLDSNLIITNAVSVQLNSLPCSPDLNPPTSCHINRSKVDLPDPRVPTTDSSGKLSQPALLANRYLNGVAMNQPVIGNITLDQAAGTYGEGAVFNITINFLNGSGGAAEKVILGAGASGTINLGYKASNQTAE